MVHVVAQWKTGRKPKEGQKVSRLELDATTTREGPGVDLRIPTVIPSDQLGYCALVGRAGNGAWDGARELGWVPRESLRYGA